LLTTDNCWSGGSAAGRRGADTGGGPPPYNDRRPETCVPSLGSHRRARRGGHTVAAASICARLRANLFLLLVPAGGGELPRPGVRVEVAAARGARGRPRPWRHLTSTVAPAASRSFLIFSASSFEAPSFTVPPASVRSLASFRPRPVMARTTLMTSTFFSPADFSTTLNSVCSSAGAAAPAAAGPAATATGAAADTPNFSSKALTRSITSTRVLLPMASRICSLERDIVITLTDWFVCRSDQWRCERRSTRTSGCLLLADRVDHAGGLRGGLGEHAGQHGGRLRDQAHQHGQGLLAGRQRRQDIHVGARVLLPTQRNQARLQLVGGLGEVLDETAGGAGVFLREGEQQRAGQLVLDDGIVGPFHRARDQRVLGNLQEHARLAGLLAQVGHLLDRETRVLRGDQRVRLGGDLGQFGNDFLLLVQIQSHCASSLASIPPRRTYAGTGHVPHRSLDAGNATEGVPSGGRFPGTGRTNHWRAATIYAGPFVLSHPGLSGLAGDGGDSLPFRASLPVAAAASAAPAVFDGSGRRQCPGRCPQN